MPPSTPQGHPGREAIDSLRGYVYQIYQSALAWTEIKDNEVLWLEVAEDFAIAAETALEAVQVKETADRVTINSDAIVCSIDSFVELQEKNPRVEVTLRHLTTSVIGKEKSTDHRLGEVPMLVTWRNLAKAGSLSEFRAVLEKSKLSRKTKAYLNSLDDISFRENFLKRIHFDCGSPDSEYLARQLNAKLARLLIDRGGVPSQAEGCKAGILLALLKLATNKNREERFVDRHSLEEHLEAATSINLNRAQFEAQQRSIDKALSASVPGAVHLSNDQTVKPSPVYEVPLPKALADREPDTSALMRRLETYGMGWIAGSAGMGKTTVTRMLAQEAGGAWASINLRGRTSEQVAQVLSEAATAIRSYGLRGLIIDDLNCALEPRVLDGLQYLVHAARSSDVLLVLVAFNPPAPEFLFLAGLDSDIVVNLREFTEEDIREILGKMGVKTAGWPKYIHLVSGGGHPQLAIAFIQSMSASGWNAEELSTWDAFLAGSPAVDDVRRRTRERLLSDLPEPSRRLIERLSLKVGAFKRELALDLAKVAPCIPDAGTILDSLIGAWVDQHQGDRFNLSPLLSDFAAKTLTTEDKKTIHVAISNSLTKGRILDVADTNSALISAWSSNNEAVILKLCMAVLQSDHEELEMLAPHLPLFTMFRTDNVAYPSNAVISHVFRGVQLLLLNQESSSSSKLLEAMACFSKEANNVPDDAMRDSMNLLVYSKLLLHTSKAGIGVHFLSVIADLDYLMGSESVSLPPDVLMNFRRVVQDGVSPIGFMFLNQVRQLSKIEDLSVVFDFLHSSTAELRSRLLAPFDHDDFPIDILVTGAWLSEHNSNTIDPRVHSATFATLEKQAASWNHNILAACCRKYRAIILDEYGNDKETALAVLDDGLKLYGETHAELVRAKAKVLYRSDDHMGSLALAKTLIESDAPLSDVEKAFLGRDAGISAEKKGDLKAARRYYLYGSDAARSSELPNMEAMRIGLLADGAIASWHDGDRLTCLQDFVAVLCNLNTLIASESLRNAHCHVATRHVLVWLRQDVTGEKIVLTDDEEIRICPGSVSNPEPHSDIGSRYIIPIEMAWYMLATVENYAVLNAGITERLDRFLPEGPVFEGQMLLAPAKMYNAMVCHNEKLFLDALKDTVSSLAFVQERRDPTSSFNIKNVTYGRIPQADRSQQEALQSLTEQFVLLYCANCLFGREGSAIPSLVTRVASASNFSVRPELLDRLQGVGPGVDFLTDYAQLVLSEARVFSELEPGTPRQAFELAFKTLQLAQQTGTLRLFDKSLVPWLEHRWRYVWEHQRFLLRQPSVHRAAIDNAFGQDGVSAQTRAVDLLAAMLPTIGIGNQREQDTILADLAK